MLGLVDISKGRSTGLFIILPSLKTSFQRRAMHKWRCYARHGGEWKTLLRVHSQVRQTNNDCVRSRVNELCSIFPYFISLPQGRFDLSGVPLLCEFGGVMLFVRLAGGRCAICGVEFTKVSDV